MGWRGINQPSCYPVLYNSLFAFPFSAPGETRLALIIPGEDCTLLQAAYSVRQQWSTIKERTHLPNAHVGVRGASYGACVVWCVCVYGAGPAQIGAIKAWAERAPAQRHLLPVVLRLLTINYVPLPISCELIMKALANLTELTPRYLRFDWEPGVFYSVLYLSRISCNGMLRLWIYYDNFNNTFTKLLFCIV